MCKSIVLLVTLQAETPCTPADALSRQPSVYVACSCCSVQFPHLLVSSSCLPSSGGHASLLLTEMEMKRARKKGDGERKQQGVKTLRRQEKKAKQRWRITDSIPAHLLAQNGPRYHGTKAENGHTICTIYLNRIAFSAAKPVRGTLAGIDGDMFWIIFTSSPM